MTIHEAINHAYRLHRKWVSDREISQGLGYDLDRIAASIRQEIQWNRRHPARCSKTLQSEIIGESILLGKVRKALNANNILPPSDAGNITMEKLQQWFINTPSSFGFRRNKYDVQ